MSQSITISTVTAPTSPVQPRSASQLLFDANYGKLATLSLKQKLVIAVLFMVHLDSGTTDYRANHAQLIQDAQVYLGGQSTPLDFWAAFDSTAYAGALTGDAATSNDVETLLTEGRDLLAKSEEDLIRMVVYLTSLITFA